MNDTQKVFHDAAQFVEENLPALCQHLINLNNRNYEPSEFQTKFFELIEMVRPLGYSVYALTNSLIASAAVRYVAKAEA